MENMYTRAPCALGQMGSLGGKGWQCLLRKIGGLAMGVTSSKPTGWLLLCMLACRKKISPGKRTVRSLQTLLTACPILEWFLIWKDFFPSVLYYGSTIVLHLWRLLWWNTTLIKSLVSRKRVCNPLPVLRIWFVGILLSIFASLFWRDTGLCLFPYSVFVSFLVLASRGPRLNFLDRFFCFCFAITLCDT